jgi:hypothetical protein
MNIINYEQEIHNECKKELETLSDEELSKIANSQSKTSFGFVNKRNKHYQIAAFEILRERKNK